MASSLHASGTGIRRTPPVIRASSVPSTRSWSTARRLRPTRPASDAPLLPVAAPAELAAPAHTKKHGRPHAVWTPRVGTCEQVGARHIRLAVHVARGGQ